MESSLAGCDTRDRDSALDRRLLLPTCQVPHAAPLSPPHGDAPKRLCGARGEGCGTAPCSPHHRGTVKVLKIPPRCLNSTWEHSRRRRRAGGLPLAGICHAEESTASSSWEIRAQDRPELPPVPKGSSLRWEVTQPRMTPLGSRAQHTLNTINNPSPAPAT